MKMMVCAHGLRTVWAQDDLYCICKVHLKILHTKYLCFSNKLISTLYMSKINIANLLRKPSQKVNPLVQGLTGKKPTTHLNFSCEVGRRAGGLLNSSGHRRRVLSATSASAPAHCWNAVHFCIS